MALKVLVLGDEIPILEILKFNLENEGYVVVCAYDGNEAVEIAESEDPELILLDLMLPEKDGNEVCRGIRKTKNMPIIMLTAKDCERDKVIGIEIGADEKSTKTTTKKAVIKGVYKNLLETKH